MVKCCGMSSVQILRRQGRVVSSSLHKPSAADIGVVRGVTEHSKWTSQTLKEASSGLPLMLPDLASGTERKCCRTQRGHRPSWPQSACQPADCGRKERVKRDRREREKETERGPGVFQEGNFKRNRKRERNKEREEDKQNIASAPIHRLAAWLLATGPLNGYTPLLHPTFLQPHLSTPFSHQEPIPLFSLSVHPSILWPMISPSFHPSFMDS